MIWACVYLCVSCKRRFCNGSIRSLGIAVKNRVRRNGSGTLIWSYIRNAMKLWRNTSPYLMLMRPFIPSALIWLIAFRTINWTNDIEVIKVKSIVELLSTFLRDSVNIFQSCLNWVSHKLPHLHCTAAPAMHPSVHVRLWEYDLYYIHLLYWTVVDGVDSRGWLHMLPCQSLYFEQNCVTVLPRSLHLSINAGENFDWSRWQAIHCFDELQPRF